MNKVTSNDILSKLKKTYLSYLQCPAKAIWKDMAIASLAPCFQRPWVGLSIVYQ